MVDNVFVRLGCEQFDYKQATIELRAKGCKAHIPIDFLGIPSILLYAAKQFPQINLFQAHIPIAK